MLDVTSQLRDCTQEKLSACEEGRCCQCGTCCIAYRMFPPSETGNVESPTFTKQSGDVCPQLAADTRGNAICLLHGAKDHPALQTCREWNGNRLTDDGHMTYFEHYCRATADWLTHPWPTADHVDRILTLHFRNAIPERAIRHAKLMAATQSLKVVKNYLHTGRLPQAIMDLLEIPESLQALGCTAKSLALELGLREGGALYTDFMFVCCPWEESETDE